MINTISTYRRFFASLLAMWMGLIVISGIVFMHKEVTSKGEIITHVHPYDFTENSKKSHHESDKEIHFLNVIFQGSFLENEFNNYIEPFYQKFLIQEHSQIIQNYISVDLIHYNLRGPPYSS